MRPLVLASASPRRQALLSDIGYHFDLAPVDIDETPYADELPLAYLARMSITKAETALAQQQDDVVVLAADTSVILDSKILGKPEGQVHFSSMMTALSGRWHEVMTSIAVCARDESGLEMTEHTEVTRVKFRELVQSEIDAYWMTGEPADKAGGYGIQGKAAIFIDRIEGSYSNVVGLPLNRTAEMLSKYGLVLEALWRTRYESSL